MSYKWIVIFISIFLASCGYKGDGEFEKHGTWPFVTYELTFPAFELNSNYETSFKIDGYKSHGTSFLYVKLISDKPVAFEKLNTEFEVRISGGLNVTYFFRKSPFNRHYLRMVEIGEASWANENEWSGRYDYSDPETKNKGVAFLPNVQPIKSKTMTYVQSLPTGKNKLKAAIKVGKVPDEFKNIKVELSLVSGWK